MVSSVTSHMQSGMHQTHVSFLWAQKLRLAVGATHVPRLLASALFACLCFRFLGAPLPQSRMLRPLWFVVNSMPPVLGLCSTLIALILRAFAAFQLSPTLLVSCCEPNCPPDWVTPAIASNTVPTLAFPSSG